MKKDLKESLQFILQHDAVGSTLVQHAQNLARHITLQHYSAEQRVTDEQILNIGRAAKLANDEQLIVHARKVLSAPAAETRCPYCDDIGDVRDQTGEWRGTCTCKVAVSLNTKSVVTSSLNTNAASQETKPVSADRWQVVPQIATSEMLSAFYAEPSLAEGWVAALDAAPQEQAPFGTPTYRLQTRSETTEEWTDVSPTDFLAAPQQGKYFRFLGAQEQAQTNSISLNAAANLAFNALHECKPNKGADAALRYHGEFANFGQPQPQQVKP